jgi:hypothetical protein
LHRKQFKYYEQKAQVIVFFKKDAPVEKYLILRDAIYDKELLESIDYVSQEDALAIYQEDFADNPDLISMLLQMHFLRVLRYRLLIDNLVTVISNINLLKKLMRMSMMSCTLRCC